VSHRTYYELFGVSPDTDVSLIRAAYRRLIRTYHPDIAGKSGEWMTHELNAALDIFCNPIKRHDRAQKILPSRRVNS
jgi:molecular chaperone DnaJ